MTSESSVSRLQTGRQGPRDLGGLTKGSPNFPVNGKATRIPRWSHREKKLFVPSQPYSKNKPGDADSSQSSHRSPSTRGGGLELRFILLISSELPGTANLETLFPVQPAAGCFAEPVSCQCGEHAGGRLTHSPQSA